MSLFYNLIKKLLVSKVEKEALIDSNIKTAFDAYEKSVKDTYYSYVKCVLTTYCPVIDLQILGLPNSSIEKENFRKNTLLFFKECDEVEQIKIIEAIEFVRSKKGLEKLNSIQKEIISEARLI